MFSSVNHYDSNLIAAPNFLKVNAQGLGIDGHNYLATPSVTSSKTVSLTTSNANDLVIVYAVSGDSKDHQYFAPVQSVTASGLTFQLRHQYQVVSSASGWYWDLEEWYAVASSPLSSTAITITWSTQPASFIIVDAFGISGANNSSPFDSNAGLPSTSSGSFPSVSTSNTNDMIISLEATDNTAQPTAGSGFTPIDASGHYFASEYQMVSTTQSSLSVTFTNSNGGSSDVEAQMADAVQEATVTTTSTTTT